MPSSFTWLDYSEHERRKMLDVIELFGDRSSRDELGLGGIRDAFADLLFPGTSTIQTRSKYFLFVPWIYSILENKETPSAKIAIRARKLETELMTALIQSPDQDGIIGKQAKEKLQRLPSNIYWQGLAAWGIRLFPGSQELYSRSLDAIYTQRRHGQDRSSEFEGESFGGHTAPTWHAGLPPVPENFPHVATFQLAVDEAEYLSERILSRCPKSLLALIVRDRIVTEGVDFAWDLESKLPEHIREQLEHGRNFSETIHGAQLLYNLMLAKLQKSEELVADYRGRLHEWQDAIAGRRDALFAWVRPRFWQIVLQANPRVSPASRTFVNTWIDFAMKSPSVESLESTRDARELIERRERRLKGGLARLCNQRALEIWNGAAGDQQLDLRWEAAQRITSDIVKGLEFAQDA